MTAHPSELPFVWDSLRQSSAIRMPDQNAAQHRGAQS